MKKINAHTGSRTDPTITTINKEKRCVFDISAGKAQKCFEQERH